MSEAEHRQSQRLLMNGCLVSEPRENQRADPKDGGCFAPPFEVNAKEKALRNLCEDSTFLWYFLN